MKAVKTEVARAVAEWIRQQGPSAVTVHDSRSVLDMTLPLAVVFAESAEPISPHEPVWDVTVRVTVMHDAEDTSPDDAETQAGELFATLDDPDVLESFLTTQGLHISAVYVTGDRLEFSEMRWHSVRTLRVIAAL